MGESTARRKKLGTIFGDVLGHPSIDIYDNFFEMGGDSIILMRAYQQIDQLYPNCVTNADMFSYTTIASLATYIQTRWKKTVQHAPAAERPEKEGVYELSDAQRRIYVESRRSKDKLLYNNPFAFSLNEPIEPERLGEAVAALAKRHDSLRTAFTLRDKRLRQIVFSEIHCPIDVVSAEAPPDLADYLTALCVMDNNEDKESRGPYTIALPSDIEDGMRRMAGKWQTTLFYSH